MAAPTESLRGVRPYPTLDGACPSALALDIDGTLTMADERVVYNLVRTARSYGAHVAINTARPPLYCLEPDPITTRLAPVADHHCYTGKSWWLRNLVHDVPTSKVANMETIEERGAVPNKRCCVLVDDRRENIEAVDAAGYTGFYVDYKRGIRRHDARNILDILRNCAIEASQTAPGDAHGPQPKPAAGPDPFRLPTK